jgi:hypothetical protein
MAPTATSFLSSTTGVSSKTAAIADGFGQMMEWAQGGRIGNTPTVNGRLGSEIAVRPNERVRVRHCHMLEHAAGGMMTWFEVT